MKSSTSHPILVIDDNQTIHQDFRKILSPITSGQSAIDEMDAALFGESRPRVRQLVFEIHSAYQGQEGLALVEKALANGLRFPVAFVDVRMPPGWDGIETVSRMWQVDPDIQIVICTAYSEYSWDDMVSKLGQSDNLLILKKPFDNIEVQQLANALTEKWHLLQEKKNQISLLEEKVKERTKELERTTEALSKSQEVVLRQERLAVVGQLSAGIAHEFNNILTVIQGHTTLLLAAGNQDARSRKSLQHVADSAERAASLTRQMLAFSRKQLLRREAVNLSGTITRMREMLRKLLSNNITLRYELSPELLPVWADAGMVEQVILDLVANAGDASPNGGEIFISVALAERETFKPMGTSMTVGSADRRSGQFVCLTVRDTGEGMDPSTMNHIFEPFFTTKDVGKGTGLGLATVYGIVQQHEGWIEVTSAVGKGTTFKVYLPVTPAVAVATQKSTAAFLSAKPTSAQTILVVEDEPALRSLVRSILTQSGYNVVEAASGPEALTICEQNHGKIDLLFTDMMMPHGISGRELAQRLQAITPDLRVIYTSGYSEAMLQDDGDRENRVFLEKPYDPRRLVEVIRRSLLPIPAERSLA